MKGIEELLIKLYSEKFKGMPQIWVDNATWRDQSGRIIEDEHNFYFIKDGGKTIYVEPQWESVGGKPYCFRCKFEIRYKNIDGKEIPYCHSCEGEPKNE